MAAAARTRYSALAIVLHWAIALSILSLVPFGWWMGDLIEDPARAAQAAAAFQLHKSLGLTVLALSLARLGVRFAVPPPALPASMPKWERFGAVAAHVAFYGLMILLPLTGWIYVSTGFTYDGRPLQVATVWFGLFEVPHLGIAAAEEPARRAVAAASMNAHGKLAWGALVLAALHIGAALKHHLVNRDGVLARMVPGLKPLGGGEDAQPVAGAARRIALAAGFGLIALGALGMGAAIVTLPPPQALAASAAPTAPVDDPATLLAEAREALAAAQSAAPATAWRVDPAGSEIRFRGTSAGAPFEGRFASWTADIRFDPKNLAGSRVLVTVRAASVDLPDNVQESTVKGAEWFDAAGHPEARFAAARFVHKGGDAYEALGVLTIKGKDTPVRLPFTVRIPNGAGPASMSGEAAIDRLAAGMGLASDPNAQWVSREIIVEVGVNAQRAP